MPDRLGLPHGHYYFRAAKRHTLADDAQKTGLRLRHDLLAAVARLAAGRNLGFNPFCIAGLAFARWPDRLVACCYRQLFRARSFWGLVVNKRRLLELPVAKPGYRLGWSMQFEVHLVPHGPALLRITSACLRLRTSRTRLLWTDLAFYLADDGQSKGWAVRRLTLVPVMKITALCRFLVERQCDRVAQTF